MKRFIIVFLFAVQLTGCLKLETDVEEHKAVPSPDGRLVARALFADSGAVSSHDQLVLLTPPDFKYTKDMELVSYRIASTQRISDQDIDLIWNGPRMLTIRFTQYGAGYVDYQSSQDGVDIYIEHIRRK